MTLDEAIQQLVTLGEKDPLTIARKLEAQQGEDWIREQVGLFAQDIVAERARRLLGQQRREYEIALRPGDTITSAEMKLAAFWVPSEHGFEYKRASDLTADDLDARAAWYKGFARGVLRRARWCRDVAALMREEGAVTLGKLKADLPPLPDDDLAELIG